MLFLIYITHFVRAYFQSQHAVTARRTKGCSKYKSHLVMINGLCEHQCEPPSSRTSNNAKKDGSQLDYYMSMLETSLNNSIKKLGLKSNKKNIEVENFNCPRSESNQTKLCILFKLVSYRVALNQRENTTKEKELTDNVLHYLCHVTCKVYQLDTAALTNLNKCDFIKKITLKKKSKKTSYNVIQDLHKYLPIAMKQLKIKPKQQPTTNSVTTMQRKRMENLKKKETMNKKQQTKSH